MACKITYSQEKHFHTVNALLRTPMGINFVKDKFEDADAIIEAFQNGELESYARPNSVSNASVNENFENNMEIINAEEEKSFSIFLF